MSVDFYVEDATYHTYVRFCCQSQVQVTYGACVRCIMGAAQSHMIINQKGMRIGYFTPVIDHTISVHGVTFPQEVVLLEEHS